MAETESKKLTERHQHSGSDDEPEQKRQKPDESEASNDVQANATETKTITNIYYDCLERIFDFLDIEDLLMVANTCKRLQIAAAAKFGDEFGAKKIWLYPRVRFINNTSKIQVYQWGVAVIGLKSCLPFLRCFGAKISHLIVRSNDDHVNQYINQYCADTLTSIEFQFRWGFSTDSFEKPFKNVETVKIDSERLTNSFTNCFMNCFPNLRHLEMARCWFDEIPPMNVSFPHLEHLHLYFRNDASRNHYESVVNILQACPQLQNLLIWSGPGLTLTTVLDAITANSLITKLKVAKNVNLTFHEREGIQVDANELNRFVAEHPLIEELLLEEHRLKTVDAINFIRQMNSLVRIGFQVADQPERVRIAEELSNEWELSSNASTTTHRAFYVEFNRR